MKITDFDKHNRENTSTPQEDFEQFKENFLSATSHELKTPLTSQRAFIQILDQMTTKNNDLIYKKYIQKIALQNEKLSQLVNNLLDASKIKDGRLMYTPSKFDLEELINEIITDFNHSHKHTIRLKGTTQNEIISDKGKVDQVITNLLHNAIKYSPITSEIIIELKTKAKSVIVSIIDAGIGIDTNNIEHIFKPFYRIHGHKERTFPGLGMGLYISNEIVKHLGGTLQVKSTKGKGSTFTMSLPIS